MQEQAIGFCFTLDEAQNGKIDEEIPLPLQRYVVSNKFGKFYSLCPDLTRLKPSDLRAAGIAKHAVIEALSAKEEITMQDFDSAKQMAYSKLLAHIGPVLANKLALLVAHDTVGFGPLSMLLEDKGNIEEIEINSPASNISIYHARHGRCTTNLRFNSEQDFRNTLNKFVSETNKELSDASPIVDVQAGDARIHAQLKPYSINGACATIRLNGKGEPSLAHLVKKGTADFDILAYLWLAIENKMSIAISGAPASGKTTLLLSLLSLVPRYSRIVTIEEDVNELKFYSNVISCVSLNGSKRFGDVDAKAQVINALRMRPDVLVVGEIRGAEARELFAGANLGVPFFTTMHSNDSGISVVKRLMVKPMSVEPNAISALDISVQMVQDGIGQRAINEVSEHLWLSRAEIVEGGIEVGDDRLRIDPIVLNSAFNAKAAKESKVLGTYERKNGLGRGGAAEELRCRSDFLKHACNEAKSPLDLIERIHRYGVGQ
ncbi:MAG: type II/IV secretion system ATPase subunit [Candidatus Micrarchaeota archaeon]|nr:type II/IV secretion system ATPase subunit [Candidatus Micrarchaeota archaeon]